MGNHKFRKKLYTTIFGTYRAIAYALFSRLYPSMPKACETESLDIIIPVTEKDLAILPLCLEGVRRCVSNKIHKIFIVGPESEQIRSVCDHKKTIFIEECSVLGYSPRDLNIIAKSGKNRSGWIFQQLLKLSGKIGDQSHFLVIDSDHILLQPHTFITAEGKSVLYQSKEYYFPYYKNIEKLTGSFPYHCLSYISHKMVFNKSVLENLRNELIHKNGSSGSTWDGIIIKSLDLSYDSSFSEFELYGNFMPGNKKIHYPWRQLTLHRSKQLPSYESLCKQFGKDYLSVTFPDYLAEN